MWNLIVENIFQTLKQDFEPNYVMKKTFLENYKKKKKKCISLAELGQIWHHEFGTVIWEVPKLYNI